MNFTVWYTHTVMFARCQTYLKDFPKSHKMQCVQLGLQGMGIPHQYSCSQMEVMVDQFKGGNLIFLKVS